MQILGRSSLPLGRLGEAIERAWWILATPATLRGLLPVPMPFQFTFVVTHRCNSRCTMCQLWCQERGTELTVDEVQRIASRGDFASITD
jgi:hypothetical protein